MNVRGPDGTTALMLATANGQVETAQALLAAKADVDARDDDGQTALAYAKQLSRPALVKLLMAAGAK